MWLNLKRATELGHPCVPHLHTGLSHDPGDLVSRRCCFLKLWCWSLLRQVTGLTQSRVMKRKTLKGGFPLHYDTLARWDSDFTVWGLLHAHTLPLSLWVVFKTNNRKPVVHKSLGDIIPSDLAQCRVHGILTKLRQRDSSQGALVWPSLCLMLLGVYLALAGLSAATSHILGCWNDIWPMRAHY